MVKQGLVSGAGSWYFMKWGSVDKTLVEKILTVLNMRFLQGDHSGFFAPRVLVSRILRYKTIYILTATAVQ